MKDIIDNFQSDLIDETYRPFYFEKSNRSKFWKIKARSKIKETDLVIFFVGNRYSSHSKNIDYELRLADHYSKEVICVPVNDCQTNLKIRDPYNMQYYLRYKSMGLDELKSYIRTNLHDYDIKNHVFRDRDPESFTIDDKMLLLEQYSEMMMSTESMMDRRQNTSSFYISINTAMVALMGVIAALGLELEILCIFIILTSVFGMIISKSWIGTLESYDRTNTSKFNVMECMEYYLPASMFAAEYRDTKNKFRSKIYPSYSEREKMIPKSFLFLYLMIVVVLTTYLIWLLL